MLIWDADDTDDDDDEDSLPFRPHSLIPATRNDTGRSLPSISVYLHIHPFPFPFMPPPPSRPVTLPVVLWVVLLRCARGLSGDIITKWMVDGGGSGSEEQRGRS